MPIEADEAHEEVNVSVPRALLIVAMALAIPAGRAHAEPPGVELAREARVHISAQGGINTPLGEAGVAVELHALPRLVLASGLGLGTSPNHDLQVAVSSRFRLWVLGNASASGGLGFSYNGDRNEAKFFQSANGGAEAVYGTWHNVIRLNPEISVEYRFGRRWTARGFGGLGVILTHGTCWYSTTAVEAPCSSPAVPAKYRDQPAPLVPYAGVALDASLPKESIGVGSPWCAGPWYGWQILLVDVASTAAILGGSDSSTVSAERHLFMYSGLTLYSLGGPAIHVAHKHETRALVSFVLRTLPTLVAFELARGKGVEYRAAPLATMASAAVIDWFVLGWRGPTDAEGTN